MARLNEVEIGSRWSARVSGRHCIVRVLEIVEGYKGKRLRLLNETTGKTLGERTAAFLRARVPDKAAPAPLEKVRDEAAEKLTAPKPATTKDDVKRALIQVEKAMDRAQVDPSTQGLINDYLHMAACRLDSLCEDYENKIAALTPNAKESAR